MIAAIEKNPFDKYDETPRISKGMRSNLKQDNCPPKRSVSTSKKKSETTKNEKFDKITLNTSDYIADNIISESKRGKSIMKKIHNELPKETTTINMVELPMEKKLTKARWDDPESIVLLKGILKYNNNWKEIRIFNQKLQNRSLTSIQGRYNTLISESSRERNNIPTDLKSSDYKSVAEWLLMNLYRVECENT